jgi:hypothetical protein
MRKLLCIVPVLLVLLYLVPSTWGETLRCGSCSDSPCVNGKPGDPCGTPSAPATCYGPWVNGNPVLCEFVGGYDCLCIPES